MYMDTEKVKAVADWPTIVRRSKGLSGLQTSMVNSQFQLHCLTLTYFDLSEGPFHLVPSH